MFTDRDAEIVEVLDASGGMDARSLMALLELGQTVAYRRLARLGDLGLVAAVRPFAGSPALYGPTAAGLREVLGREDLSPPSISTVSYNHQLQVGRVIAELERHGVRWESSRVTRRRQLEAHAAGASERARRFSIRLSWQQRFHLPDILIWPSAHAEEHDRPIALEVELTQKTKARLDEILRGYDLSPDFAGVVYICGGRNAQAAVAKAAARSNAQGARPIQIATLSEFGRHVLPASSEPWLDRWLTPGPASALEAYFAHSAPPARGAQLRLLEA